MDYNTQNRKEWIKEHTFNPSPKTFLTAIIIMSAILIANQFIV